MSMVGSLDNWRQWEILSLKDRLKIEEKNKETLLFNI